MIFVPRRINSLISAVFASFAVKIYLTCGQIKPLNRKVRLGLRKGRKGTPRILNSEHSFAPGRNLGQPLPYVGQPNNLAKQLNN